MTHVVFQIAKNIYFKQVILWTVRQTCRLIIPPMLYWKCFKIEPAVAKLCSKIDVLLFPECGVVMITCLLSQSSITESTDEVIIIVLMLGAGPCLNGNGGCSQFCWTTAAMSRICDCSLGFYLSQDGQTCHASTCLPNINRFQVHTHH